MQSKAERLMSVFPQKNGTERCYQIHVIKKFALKEMR